MTTIQSILENAWKDGFFFHLRYGEFNEQEYNILKQQLTSCPETDEPTLDKELVRNLWLIPTFLENNKDFLLKRGLNKSVFTQMYDGLTNECERILGMP